MSKSRKTRKGKKYTPNRWCSLALVFPKADLDKVRQMILTVQLAVEMKLPFGKIDLDDVSQMRDLINLGMTLIAAGHGIDLDDLCENYGKRWEDGHDAFHTYYEKAWKRGIFTCTAAELKGIRDEIEIAGAIIEIELDVEPFRVMKAFAAMKTMTNSPTGEGISFDPDKLRRRIDSLACYETTFMQKGRKASVAERT